MMSVKSAKGRIRQKPGTCLVAVAMLWLAAPVVAGDKEAGKELSVTCAACHGEDGVGTLDIYPIIAGQYEDYLVHALKAYRDGKRKNIIMGGMAAALSDDDIKNLAAYYAAMPSPLKVVPND